MNICITSDQWWAQIIDHTPAVPAVFLMPANANAKHTWQTKKSCVQIVKRKKKSHNLQKRIKQFFIFFFQAQNKLFCLSFKRSVAGCCRAGLTFASTRDLRGTAGIAQSHRTPKLVPTWRIHLALYFILERFFSAQKEIFYTGRLGLMQSIFPSAPKLNISFSFV